MSGQSPPVGYSSPGASGSRRPSGQSTTTTPARPSDGMRSSQSGEMGDLARELDGSSYSRRPRAPFDSPNQSSITTTPTRPPAIPRSSSITASIDFFESKSRDATSPKPVVENGVGTCRPKRDPRKGLGIDMDGRRGVSESGLPVLMAITRSSTPPAYPPSSSTYSRQEDSAFTSKGIAKPASPKPFGPRNMTPPSREGRRLSYQPANGMDESVRKSFDDPRRGLGLNDVTAESRRRVSESASSVPGPMAGPSRIRPRASNNGMGPTVYDQAIPMDRSLSGKGKEKASTSSQGLSPSRSSSTSRRDRPILRPRQPSQSSERSQSHSRSTQHHPIATKPAIRVVQPTPSSASAARRRTSAPPESPITPTRTRAFSPAEQSSSSSQQSQLTSGSSSRSIRPGSRRTSYHLAKSTSIDGGSLRGSITTEFGVLESVEQSPTLGRFVESFGGGDEDGGTVDPLSRYRGSQRAEDGTSPEIPHYTGTPLLDTSPFIIQRTNGTRIGEDDIWGSGPSSPGNSQASSYASAKSPSSPTASANGGSKRPAIPHRYSSASGGQSPPTISKRTSSIDFNAYLQSPRSLLENTQSKEKLMGLGLDQSPDLDSDGLATRRISEETAIARRSIDSEGRSPTIQTLSPDPNQILKTPSLDSHLPVTPDPQDPSLTSTTPRWDRKSPGLTIKPPPPRPPRDTARPSPPIPIKSPLRRLTPQQSSLSDLKEGRSPRVRDGSGESALATGSSRTESFQTAPLASGSSDADTTESKDELVLEPGDVIAYPASLDSHNHDSEIRFTMLTVPSTYSQDSAPSTARTIPDSEWSAGASTSASDSRTERSGSFGWGRQRQSVVSMDGNPSDFGDIPNGNRATSLPRLRISGTSDTSKTLPETPTPGGTPTTANTTSSASHDVDAGHSPLSPVRSPSMPAMNSSVETPRKAAKLLGLGLNDQTTPRSKPNPGMTRSQTTPLATLMPHHTTSAHPNGLSPDPGLGLGNPILNISKRAHLVREIVSTERSYSNDLALIREAYLLRYIRPTSLVSTNDSTAAAGSETSRRSSIYTYQTAETKRSSGVDLPLLPASKSPGAEYPSSTSLTLQGNGHGYFPPTSGSGPGPGLGGMVTSMSTSSLAVAGAGTVSSMRNTSVGSSIGSMGPPVGKPLSPADVRNVFLNLDQLAGAAEEMANAMEAAMGDITPPTVGRDGETGNDRLGEVFVNLVPKFRSIYGFYCARQLSASARLQELFADPAHATFLNDCWSHVNAHTNAWNLDSMLIKPVQRITKYPLLFDDLLACTTPVHPDYFNIRNAATMARGVAQEIDESNRRKDVVAGVISKNGKSTKLIRPTATGDGKPKGLKLFRKEKSTSSVPMSSSNQQGSSTGVNGSHTSGQPSSNVSQGTTTGLAGASDAGGVAKLTKVSLSEFRDLHNKVDQCEQCVRKVGKEIILWTAAAKDVFMIQDGLVKAWLGLITLDGQEGSDPKLVWFRKVIAGIVNDAWRSLNDEVQDQVMPALSKLLESGVNPRKVISKRDLKAPDYARYFSLIEAKKPIDRTILQSAKDFVALHTQLVEELPLFLEGYMRIFDLAMCTFANSQAMYHSKVRDRVGGFIREHLEEGATAKSPRVSLETRSRSSGPPADLKSIAGIVRNWSDAWSPYADAVDNFQSTKPARQAATRLATFHDRPGSHTPSHARQASGLSRTGSRSNSPLPSPSRPTTPSLNPSPRSPTFLKEAKLRARSTSLIGPPPLPSPTKEKEPSRFFGVLTHRSHKSPNAGQTVSSSSVMGKSSTNPGLSIPRQESPMKDIPRLRSPSPIDPSIRNSFGLPTISPDNGRFSGLGWSPVRPASPGLRNASDPTYRPNSRGHSRNGSTSSLISNPGLGFNFSSGSRSGAGNPSTNGNGGTMANLMRRKSSSRKSSSDSSTSRSERRRKAMSMVSAMEAMSPPTEFVNDNDHRLGNGHYTPRAAARPRMEYHRSKTEVDAADGWRGEKVLYQCACVASFEPGLYGRRRYRGLDFLQMSVGDLFDVFHEVGRIDELPSFPFPEIGVDNDGVLVAQSETGDIGLVICSFLEPLT